MRRAELTSDLARRLRAWWRALRLAWRRTRCRHRWVLVAVQETPRWEPAASNVVEEAGPRFGAAGGNVLSGEALVFGLAVAFARTRLSFRSAPAPEGTTHAAMVCRLCGEAALSEEAELEDARVGRSERQIGAHPAPGRAFRTPDRGSPGAGSGRP